MTKSLLNLKNKRKLDVVITTSWDDFTEQDERLVQLLLEYRIPAIFYIPYNALLREGAMRLAKRVSKRFGIGSHTVNHKILTKISNDELTEEVFGSKQLLESSLEIPINSFCYPRGRYNQKVINVVKEAGYTSARTVDVLNTDILTDPYRIKTTIHAFSGRQEYKGDCWVDIGLRKLDEVLLCGGYFHLWGHSKEIEKNKEWTNLEWFLSYLSNRINEDILS